MLRMTETEAAVRFGLKVLDRPKAEKPNKYRNKKCRWRDQEFDSILERDRFIILFDLQRSGEIYDLRRQVKFVLIPKQTVNGKVAERECSYRADFVYRLPSGEMVVEDTKGVRTREYVIKRKLLLERYGIQIREIGKGKSHGI